MPLVTITRLKAADLFQVQEQTATNATLADVITALQAGYQVSANILLNTNCPTCQDGGIPQGFLPGELPSGTAVKIPCTNCHGYLRIYTPGGPLPLPVNPFPDPLEVMRLLPADLRQALNGFPSSLTLDAMIVSLQNNYDVPLTHDCPQCSHTGLRVISAVTVICNLCTGQQKTQLEYAIVDGVIIVVPPVIPPPDPAITPILIP